MLVLVKTSTTQKDFAVYIGKDLENMAIHYHVLRATENTASVKLKFTEPGYT